jgi:type II secretory pathway pseudopilin PulG
MRTGRPVRRAATLLEALLVVAIIGVLLGLLLVAVQKAREAAAVSACRNNMRQLGIAVHSYQTAFGELPPYTTGYPPGTPVGNWLFYLSPYLEAPALQSNLPSASANPVSSTAVVTGTGLTAVKLQVLRCPSDPSARLEAYWGTTSYLANWYALSGESGGYYAPAQRPENLTNGLSNTVLFAEAYQVCDGLPRMALTSTWYHNFGITQEEKPSDDPSYAPQDYTLFQTRPLVAGGANGCDKWRAQTPHVAMNVTLADGSVRAVQAGISGETWKHLLKPQSGAPVGSGW